MEVKSNLPLDSHAELFRWGPVPMRIFYISDFLEGIFSTHFFRKAYPGYMWPKGLALSRDNRFVFLNEFSELRREGGKVFVDLMLPATVREKVYQSWKSDLSFLENEEQRVGNGNLHSLSTDEFLGLWVRFHQATVGFWRHVTVPEVANYGSLEILEEKIKNRIPDASEGARVMEILTAPERPSFYKQEEVELAETSDITLHQRRYFWLRNSYAGVEVLPESFFAERKRTIPQDVRQHLADEVKNIRERKSACFQQYTFPVEVADIAQAIVTGIEWQDERKKHIWIYLHFKDLLLAECSRRMGVSKDDLLNLRELEIERLLLGEDMTTFIKERKTFVGFLCGDGNVKALSASETEKYWNMYAEENPTVALDTFSGTVVSVGRSPLIRGVARLILDPKQSNLLKVGEILVTSMTTPEYVFAMRQAAAVITDTGGLTSHAAIVSRELKIPCVVGTRMATKVLKDGDLVEVDANQGIVTVIKRG